MIFFSVIAVLLSTIVNVSGDTPTPLNIDENKSYDNLKRLNECCNDWCQHDNILGKWIGRSLYPPVPHGNAFGRVDSYEQCSCSLVYFSADNFYKLGGYEKCQATNFNADTCDCGQDDTDGDSINRGIDYCKEKFGTVKFIEGDFSSSSGVCFCRATLEGGSAGTIEKTVWRSSCVEHGRKDQDEQTHFPQSVCPDLEGNSDEMMDDGEASESTDVDTSNEQKNDVETTKEDNEEPTNAELDEEETTSVELDEDESTNVQRDEEDESTDVQTDREESTNGQTEEEEEDMTNERPDDEDENKERTDEEEKKKLLSHDTDSMIEQVVGSWEEGFLRGASR